MSVIVGRALPDIRDGLKPVHRRILFGMHDMGLQPNRPTRKCAKIAGEVMGKYHPARRLRDLRCLGAHGAAVLHALSAGGWAGKFRFGRWRSAGGRAVHRSAAVAHCHRAAGRYRQGNRRFPPNYDDSEQEPEVLPTRVPNLLVNGSSGIAVGMATNIPPHNLTEIINATIYLIQHPRYAAGKDYGIGAGSGLPDRRLHSRPPGHSRRLHHRARPAEDARRVPKSSASARTASRSSSTEIPYQVNKSRLIEQIAALVNEKSIEGISDIRDESDRDGMRIVFELKRGEQAEVVLNNLYKHTQLADRLRHHHAVDRQRPAARTGPDRHDQVLHRSPRRSGAPPHRIRTAQGARARAYLARLPESAGQPRRGDHV